MDEPKQSRRRAVFLRPEALSQLKEALSNTWSAQPGPGKLTREEKARILGVSLATSERILKGHGVDRPSLAIAFKNVGLVWDDAFCKYEADEASLKAQVPTEPSLSAKSRPFKLSRMKWGIASTVAIVMAASTYLVAQLHLGPDNLRRLVVENLRSAEAEYYAGNYADGRRHVSDAIEIAKRGGDAASLMESLRVGGDLALAAGDTDSAREDFLLALSVRKKLGQTKSFPALWEALGNVEIQANNLEQARRYMSQSLEGYLAIKDLGGIAMGYRGLGTVTHLQGQLKNAHAFFEKGLAAQSKDKAMIWDIMARIALVKRDEGRLDEARGELKKCLNHWQKDGHPRWIATTQFQLATVESRSGNLDIATPLLISSKAAYENLGDMYGKSQCERWLSNSGASNRKIVQK